MQTHKCTFTWIPDRRIQDAERPHLPNTVAGILLNWRIVHSLRKEEQVADHLVPVTASISYSEVDDPNAWEDLQRRAVEKSVQCERN